MTGAARERSRPRARLAALRLSEARERPELLEAEWLVPAEAAELAGRPLRSLAGVVALKRALVELAAELLPGSRPTARDFVVGRRPNGAPEVRSAPELPGRLFVSITHDRLTAYGLAVLDEEPAPGGEGAPPP